MKLLFIHGAGGWDDDQALAGELSAEAGAILVMPHLPDEDMAYEAWAQPVREALARLGNDAIAVGHSFGASILLKVLAESPATHVRGVLLAMPDWGPQGWDVPEYAHEGPPPRTELTLHHCRDDDVVPFEHLARHAARLPDAQVVEHATGGHQFVGRAAAIMQAAAAGPPTMRW